MLQEEGVFIAGHSVQERVAGEITTILGMRVVARRKGFSLARHIKEVCLEKGVAFAKSWCEEYGSTPFFCRKKSVGCYHTVMSRFRWGGEMLRLHMPEARRRWPAHFTELEKLVQVPFAAPAGAGWRAVKAFHRLPSIDQVAQLATFDYLCTLGRALHEQPKQKSLVDAWETSKKVYPVEHRTIRGILAWRAPNAVEGDAPGQEAGEDALLTAIDWDYEHYERGFDLLRVDWGGHSGGGRPLRTIPYDEKLFSPPGKDGSRDEVVYLREKRRYARLLIERISAGAESVLLALVDGGYAWTSEEGGATGGVPPRQGKAGAASYTFYLLRPGRESVAVLTRTSRAPRRSDGWVEESHGIWALTTTVLEALDAETGTDGAQVGEEDLLRLAAALRGCSVFAIGQDNNACLSVIGNRKQRARPEWPVLARAAFNFAQIHRRCGKAPIYAWYPGHIWEPRESEAKRVAMDRGWDVDDLDAFFKLMKRTGLSMEGLAVSCPEGRGQLWGRINDAVSAASQTGGCPRLVGVSLDRTFAIALAMWQAMQAAVDPHGHNKVDADCGRAIRGETMSETGDTAPFRDRRMSANSLKTYFAEAVFDFDGELQACLTEAWFGKERGAPASWSGTFRPWSHAHMCNHSLTNELWHVLMFNQPVSEGPCGWGGCRERPTPMHLLTSGHHVAAAGLKIPNRFGVASKPPGVNVEDWKDGLVRSAHDFVRTQRLELAEAVARKFPEEWGPVAGALASPALKRFPTKLFNRLLRNFESALEGEDYDAYHEDVLMQGVNLADAGQECAFL
jgi:hypothetical protein